jgi:hypothetical protein
VEAIVKVQKGLSEGSHFLSVELLQQKLANQSNSDKKNFSLGRTAGQKTNIRISLTACQEHSSKCVASITSFNPYHYLRKQVL